MMRHLIDIKIYLDSILEYVNKSKIYHLVRNVFFASCVLLNPPHNCPWINLLSTGVDILSTGIDCPAFC